MHPSHQASSEILMVICFRAFLGVYAAGMANGFLSFFCKQDVGRPVWAG